MLRHASTLAAVGGAERSRPFAGLRDALLSRFRETRSRADVDEAIRMGEIGVDLAAGNVGFAFIVGGRQAPHCVWLPELNERVLREKLNPLYVEGYNNRLRPTRGRFARPGGGHALTLPLSRAGASVPPTIES